MVFIRSILFKSLEHTKISKMSLTWRRLHWSIRLHGMRLTVSKMAARILERFGVPTAESLADSVMLFDRRFHVSTAGDVDTQSLNLSPQVREHAVEYTPSCPIELAVLFEHLNVTPSKRVFIDFGCGKGLVTLVATQFPFLSVVGVEYSDELCRLAQENVRKLRSLNPSSPDVSIWKGDAREYPLPDFPLVLYFYNPFDGVVMTEIIARLADSLVKVPRDCLVIYRNPVHRRILDEDVRFRSRQLPSLFSNRFAVYDWQSS